MKKFLTYLSYCLLISSSVHANLILNEIMYHAPEAELEYIELYNTGSQSVSLSGWTLKDNQDSHTYRFPAGAIVQANDYYVVVSNENIFQSKYGISPDAAGIGFNFSNSGDSVRLYDSAGQLVETVGYDDRAPWPEAADGNGSSLERRSPLIPAHLPAAWAASSNAGTPGARNTAIIDQVPPLILEVDHSPKIPEPLSRITVTAKVLAVQSPIESVTLRYAWKGVSVYRSVAMYDDGQHQDGEAGDGVYGVDLPGGQARDLFAFFVEVNDAAGLSSILPAEAQESPYLTVVETALPNELAAIHRVVMLPQIRQRFLDRFRTDEYFPATFYDGDTVYYNVHIRHRGRSPVQNGRFKIRFPHDQLYRGKMRRVNYNGTDTSMLLKEFLSFQLYQDAGIPNLETELVRFHINGGPAAGIPYRVAIENPDSQFLKRKHYFRNDNGNLYKTTLDGTPNNKATWRYVGDDPDLYSGTYIKQTNEEEADYSDIIRFCKVLSEADPQDPNFLEQIGSVLHVNDFIRWMAVSACVAHWDSPFTDHGHNYVLYHNPNSDLFHIIAWDLNGTFRNPTNPGDINYRKEYTHVRSTKFDSINKILNHPVLGAQYYRHIDFLMDTLFSRLEMNRRIDEAGRTIGMSGNSLNFLKNYVTQRRLDMAEWIGREKGMVFLTEPNYQVTVGEFYQYPAVAVSYRVSGGVDYELIQAPDWLHISSAGILSGVATELGDHSVTIRAKNSEGITLDQTFTLQVVRPQPLLILNMNEDGSTLNDLGSYGNHGSLLGGARRVAGRLGRALYLDGSRGYAEIPHHESLNLTGSITVEAWIRPDSISNGNPVIITKGDDNLFNYNLMLGYGPFTWDAMEPCFMPHRFDIENRVYYGRKEIEARLRGGEWVHIAGTYDSARELVCVYVNNRRIVESANRSRMAPNTRSLMLGLTNNRGFRGAVDDVKILSFAKTEFAAGLCLSQVDISGISAAQDRVALSLSPLRKESLNMKEYCLFRPNTGEWLLLPDRSLKAGESILFWLDELGSSLPFQSSETLALYPSSYLGQPGPRVILDQITWGDSAPDTMNAGVRAGLWLPDESIPLQANIPNSLSLREFADNDEMSLDWQSEPQALSGPNISTFSLESGAEVVHQQSVTLKIAAEGNPRFMRISNIPSFSAEWQPYSQSMQWVLEPGEGLKTIYLQLQDFAGQRSSVAEVNVRLQMNTGVESWVQYEN